jgi:hypothetical protein
MSNKGEGVNSTKAMSGSVPKGVLKPTARPAQEPRMKERLAFAFYRNGRLQQRINTLKKSTSNLDKYSQEVFRRQTLRKSSQDAERR